jgi:hypothetical protein
MNRLRRSAVRKTSPYEVITSMKCRISGMPAVGNIRCLERFRLTSTVTCMMTHVKDPAPVATMTDVLRAAVHHRARLTPIREGSGLSPWRPSSTP